MAGVGEVLLARVGEVLLAGVGEVLLIGWCGRGPLIGWCGRGPIGSCGRGPIGWCGRGPLIGWCGRGPINWLVWEKSYWTCTANAALCQMLSGLCTGCVCMPRGQWSDAPSTSWPKQVYMLTGVCLPMHTHTDWSVPAHAYTH